MDGTFNGQILMEKLTKLNSTQQSIETLSHWCIFHRKKARQVVEIWDRHFHGSQQQQRVPLLYLANDILQNSRRKGFEFVGEFWNVLPDALNDVYKNGGDEGRNVVSRLVGIWEERKLFGSRGQVLRQEVLGRNADNGNKNEKSTTYKLKRPCGDILEKIISSYEHVHDNLVDEDNLFGRCHTAISYVEKTEKEIGNENIGNLNGSGAMKELQEQHGVLRECIEQLAIAESSRVNIVSLLKEATREQETIIERIRNQLQVAQSRHEQAGNIFQQLLSINAGHLPPEQRPKDPSPTDTLVGSGDGEKSTAVRYIQQMPFAEISPQTQEEHRKSAAAEMAERLTASTSSAQMLSFIMSSLASEGVISHSAQEDYSSDPKRPRLENGADPYIPSQSQPPPPSYPHPDTMQQPPPPQQSSPMRNPSPQLQLQRPAPLSMPPLSYMQTAGTMMSVPHTYGSVLPPLMPPFAGYPIVGMPSYFGPPNHYQNVNFQPSEVGLINHVPPPTPPSMARE